MTSVALDAEGTQLVVLRVAYGQNGPSGRLAGYTWSDGGFRDPAAVRRPAPLSGSGYVTPPVTAGDVRMAGLWDGRALALLSGPDLVPVGRVESPFPPDFFRGALVLDPAGAARPPLCVLFDEETAWLVWPPLPGGAPEAVPVRFRSGWRPGLADGSALAHPPLAHWRSDASKLDLVEVDEAGTLRWSVLMVSTFQPTPGALAYSTAQRYRAATFVGPERVAAARSGGVDWLRRGEGRLLLTSTTAANLADAVACFYSPLTRELLTATAGGDVVRVAAPNV